MPYILIYLALSLSALASNTRILLLAWTVFLFFLAGFREWVGCDFGQYLARYELHQNYSWADLTALNEPAFEAVNHILSLLGLHYMWLNAVISAILIFAIYVFAKNRGVNTKYLALAFPILIVQLGMSGVRQALALALLFFALDAFIKKKRLMTGVFILAGGLFHTSVVAFLPLVFVIGKPISIWRLLGATLVALPVAIFFAGDRLDVYQTRYIAEDVESFGAVYRVVLLLVTAIFFELYRKRYAKLYPDEFPLMRIFSILSFAVAGIYFVSALAAHRLAFYVMSVHLLMLIRLPSVMRPNKPDPMITLAPFVAYGAYIIVWFGLSDHAQACYIPYDSYLF